MHHFFQIYNLLKNIRSHIVHSKRVYLKSMGRGACAEAQCTAPATVQNNPQPLSKGIIHTGQLIPYSNGIKSRKQNISIPLNFFSKCFCIFQRQIIYSSVIQKSPLVQLIQEQRLSIEIYSTNSKQYVITLEVTPDSISFSKH